MMYLLYLYNLLCNVPCSVSVVMFGDRTSVHPPPCSSIVIDWETVMTCWSIAVIVVVMIIVGGVWVMCYNIHVLSGVSCDFRVRDSCDSGPVV